MSNHNPLYHIVEELISAGMAEEDAIAYQRSIFDTLSTINSNDYLKRNRNINNVEKDPIQDVSFMKNEEYVNRVFEGDCLEVMHKLPDNSIDMVLCDLPYGTTQNKWDSIIPLDKLWKEYSRIVKDNGAIVLTSHGVFTAILINSNPSMYRYKWIWVKSKATNFLNAKKQPLRKHEEVCMTIKKNLKLSVLFW